jgi:Flp pilus assembly protein TadG
VRPVELVAGRMARPRPARGASTTRTERGQASVELLAALPALLLLGLFAFQMLAVGYSAALAGTAAEAAALAAAGGADPEAAARAAVPGWSRARMEVRESDGSVEVTMRPPAPFEDVERALAVSASASVRAP